MERRPINKNLLLEQTMQYKVFTGMFILVLSVACSKRKAIRFELFPAQSHYTAAGPGYDSTLIWVYLVHNYSSNKRIEATIDSFACSNVQDLVNKYSRIRLEFYKVSDKTNAEYLKKHPNYFDVGSLYNDFLWTYDYTKEQGFVLKSKPKSIENVEFFYPYPTCDLRP